MAITTLDGYIAAVKQLVLWNKTTTRTTVAAVPFSLFDIAGSPGAGTLSAGNTANGIVPTDATTGYPTINAITGVGYISKIIFANTVAARIALYDRLFSAGAYAFNASTTLASQPSYSGRLPGTDYKGLEIWIETVTAFTGTLSVAITYTNQDGTTGRTTGTVSVGATLIIGRMFRMPLQAGDTGVQKIESVTATVASAGTFNVHVMRKLWEGRILAANDGDVHDMLKTGMPQIYTDSALFPVIYADSTSSGLPSIDIEIAQG